MRRIKLEDIAEVAKNRPEGYIAEVLAAAESVTETHVLMTEAEYQRLKQKYSPKIKFIETVANCPHRGEEDLQP